MADEPSLARLLEHGDPRRMFHDPALELELREPYGPPLPDGQPDARPDMPHSRRQALDDLGRQAWRGVERLYERATTPLPTDPRERFKAQFGVDPDLPWLDFHAQAMRNFMDKARSAVPGVRTGMAAYDAYYDPEHPVTQQNQSTKDAAILAGLTAADVAMPWIAKGGRSLAVPPALSKHPNQRGENFWFSLPGMLPASYGIKAPK